MGPTAPPYLVPISRFQLRLVGLAHRLPIGALENFNAVLDGHFYDLLTVLSSMNPHVSFRTELIAQELVEGGLLLTLGKTAVVDPQHDTAFSRGVLTTAHLDDFTRSFFGDARVRASIVADLRRNNPYLCADLTDLRTGGGATQAPPDVVARAHGDGDAAGTGAAAAAGRTVSSVVAVGIEVVAGLAAYVHVARLKIESK